MHYIWYSGESPDIESCKGVLSCFFSADLEKQQKKCIDSFSNQIKSYRKEVATIVNSIKHNQRFIRIVYFHLIGGFVPGYFIEGVLGDGVLGPDKLIHKHANTAISFNRNLPMHICNIFFISNILSQSIYEITNKAMPKKNEKPYKNEYLGKILKFISLSRLIFFPNEIKEPILYIRCSNKRNKDVKILLEMPSKKVKPTGVPDNCKITTTVYFSESSKIYKPPYFGSNVPQT